MHMYRLHAAAVCWCPVMHPAYPAHLLLLPAGHIGSARSVLLLACRRGSDAGTTNGVRGRPSSSCRTGHPTYGSQAYLVHLLCLLPVAVVGPPVAGPVVQLELLHFALCQSAHNAVLAACIHRGHPMAMGTSHRYLPIRVTVRGLQRGSADPHRSPAGWLRAVAAREAKVAAWHWHAPVVLQWRRRV